MPSMRPQALSPRVPPVPSANSTAKPLAAGASLSAPPASAIDALSAADSAPTSGGFHESSYELQFGLQISESDWPEDVTLPGALDES